MSSEIKAALILYNEAIESLEMAEQQVQIALQNIKTVAGTATIVVDSQYFQVRERRKKLYLCELNGKPKGRPVGSKRKSVAPEAEVAAAAADVATDAAAAADVATDVATPEAVAPEAVATEVAAPDVATEAVVATEVAALDVAALDVAAPDVAATEVAAVVPDVAAEVAAEVAADEGSDLGDDEESPDPDMPLTSYAEIHASAGE